MEREQITETEETQEAERGQITETEGNPNQGGGSTVIERTNNYIVHQKD